jgi:hypothetical protein
MGAIRAVGIAFTSAATQRCTFAARTSPRARFNSADVEVSERVTDGGCASNDTGVRITLRENDVRTLRVLRVGSSATLSN